MPNLYHTLIRPLNPYLCAVRILLYDDILQEIQALLSAYPTCNYLIGGDFNVSLDCRSPPGDVVNCF